MANRPLYDTVWARDAEVGTYPAGFIADPDTDATHPLYTTLDYSLGWQTYDPLFGSKQPVQWINYFYNKVETAQVLQLEHLNKWMTGVNYRVGAVVVKGSNAWIAKTPNVGVDPATDLGVHWAQSAMMHRSRTAGESIIAAKVTVGRTHIEDMNNPHEVTAFQVGTYTIAESNGYTAVLSNTLQAHKDRRDNPHNVTYTQLNILPTTGGVFTGDVSLLRMVLPHTSKVELTMSTMALARGIDSLNLCTKANFNGAKLLTKQNFKSVKTSNNKSFTPLKPDLWMPLVCDLNSLHSSYTATYTRSTELVYDDKSKTRSVSR